MVMIDELLPRILAAKAGDAEFILARCPSGEWFAAIGNQSDHVALGEAITYGEKYADFYAEGGTASDALGALAVKMNVTA